MTASIDTQILTSQDVLALRKADSVSFHHHDGRTYMRAGLRTFGTEQRIYTAAEQSVFPLTDVVDDRAREIDCDGIVDTYETDSVRRRLGAGVSAFAMKHAARHSAVWTTITGLLRGGDSLRLVFTGNQFSNEYSRKADLHVDGLMVVVTTKSGKKMTFLLDVSVCADNTARMVRFA